MGKNVFVLGSVNYDLMAVANRLPQQGETIQGTDFIEALGGKGNNQASACSRLGAKTYFIGSVGGDSFGEIARSDMEDFGLDLTHLKTNESTSTGTAVIISIDGDNRIIINPGANDKVDLDQVQEGLKQAKPEDIFISQFENPQDLVLKSLSLAKEKGMTTILNPAPACEFPLDSYQDIDYLIVNETETEYLTGILPQDEKTCKEAGEVFFQRGVTSVIITLGSLGSVYLDKNTYLFKPAYKVSVKDTTGAGDTFIGAFSYGLANDKPIEENLAFSNACGALACTKYGAKSGMPNLREVEEFLAS